MKEKKGMVLVQVLIISFILFIISSMLIKWSLQMTLTRSKAAKSVSGLSELEKVRAEMWGCLNDNGYPSGNCSPTPAQRQCIPPSVSADFSGAPPECVLTLSIER